MNGGRAKREWLEFIETADEYGMAADENRDLANGLRDRFLRRRDYPSIRSVDEVVEE